MDVLNRFLKYVQIDTQADAYSATSPSTIKQLDLANLLVDELKQLHLDDVYLSEHGIVYAHLPGQGSQKEQPTIGLIAHLDTALEASGANAKPRIIKDYDGQSIILNSQKNIILDVNQFPHMALLKGKTLVVTDGTTLLGADDKAGIAIVMSLLTYLVNHADEHPPISVAFTSDEEIGRGVDHFDLKRFKADFAYTIDGGPLNYFSYENFNASEALVEVSGVPIHPGSAKDKLINAQQVFFDFHDLLPKQMVPELTDGYDGFHLLIDCSGQVASFKAKYIIRHFEQQQLSEHEQLFIDAAQKINDRYHKQLIKVTINRGYQNMKPIIDQHPLVIELVKQAYQKLNIDLFIVPIRGGTDGARLSYMGLPTPNLATGGYHAHSVYELVVLEEMEQIVNLLKQLLQLIK